jgi:cysteine-rich repeat protein
VFPFCGDTITDPGEQCDDGNASNNDACVQGCQNAACGDGFLFTGVEQCDDGNTLPGDGCSPICTLPICGDGQLEPGEQCDLGALNADRPALETEHQGAKTAVSPFDNPQDAAVFYNYFSASSHTGFEAPQVSRIYFYRNIITESLSLVMHHHQDSVFLPQTTVAFTLSGVPAVVNVALSDDTPGELFKQNATTVIGNWFFANNTDGGVLTGFPLPGNWQVTLAPTFGPAIITWQFMDGSVMFLPLNKSQNLILRAYDTPSACRLDCTVPFCGDGIADGGEVCDDGNNVGGDGCAANCTSLNG